MKITMEHSGYKVTVEDEDAVTIDRVMELVCNAILGSGFAPETLENGIAYMASDMGIAVMSMEATSIDEFIAKLEQEEE